MNSQELHMTLGQFKVILLRCPLCYCLAGIILNGAVAWDINDHYREVHDYELPVPLDNG